MHFLILTNPHDLSIMWVFIKLLRLNVTFKQTCEYVFKTWHSELRSDFTKQSVNQSCQKPFFLFKFSICIQILLCEDFYLIVFTTTKILSLLNVSWKETRKENKKKDGNKRKWNNNWCLLYNEIVFSGKSELYQEWLHGKSAYTHFTGIGACQLLWCYKLTVLSKDHLLNFLARGSLMILLLTPT